MCEEYVEQGNFYEVPVEPKDLFLDVFGFQGGQVIHGNGKHDDAVNKYDDADGWSFVDSEKKDEEDDHCKVKEEEQVFNVGEAYILQVFPLYSGLKMNVDTFTNEL